MLILNLTLTSVVFEFALLFSVIVPVFHLTLTSVVFELQREEMEGFR